MTLGEIAVEQVRRNFSEHADEYERYAVVQKRVVRTLLDRLPPEATSLGPVLDLGTGTGDLACSFHARHPDQSLTIVDLAHNMTRCAADRLPGVLAFDADAEALPLVDHSFGLVLSSSMYQWVNDLPQAFSEVARILKPGGLFAFALFAEETLHELRTAHTAALAACGSGGVSHMPHFPRPDAVRSALSAAGLQGELHVGYEVEEHPDVATLLRHLKHIGAQNASPDRPSGLGGRRTTLRMMEIYTERFGRAGRIPVTWQVLYGIARTGDS